MAVFCSESMECFPGISSRHFLRPLVTVSVSPMSTGITEHFMCHIRWISTHRFLYFNLFSVSIRVTFLSDCTETCISVQILSFLFWLLFMVNNNNILLLLLLLLLLFLYSSLLGFGGFSVFWSYTQSVRSLERGISPLKASAYTQNNTNTEWTYIKIFMPWLGLEPMIPAFERAKTIHALGRAATVVGTMMSPRK
jgi:hypothetical protein